MSEQFHPNKFRIDQALKSEISACGFSDITVASIMAARLGARKLIAHHAESPAKLRTRFKQDGTAVTVADEQSENVIASYMKRVFPGIRIFGKETGFSGNINSKEVLHVDPLDGTGFYSRGGDSSTVGIALRADNQTQFAVACSPFHGIIVVSEIGKGTWSIPIDRYNLSINGKPEQRRVSKVAKLRDRACIQLDASYFPKNATRKAAFIARLIELADLRYNPSQKINDHYVIVAPWSNIYQQLMVSIGIADGNVTDCRGIPTDVLFGDLAIREAGGQSTDLYKQPIDENTQLAVYSNGLLHDELIAALLPFYEGYDGFQ